jgi:hypothetical protein
VWHFAEGLEVRHDGIAVEGDSDGALEDIDGDDEAVVVLDAEDAAVEAGEGSGDDADALAFVEKRERAKAAAGVEDAEEGLDFGGGDGRGTGAEVDEADGAGESDEFEGGGGVEAAEEVAGEEGAVDGFDAVGPLAEVGVEGEHGFDAVGAEGGEQGAFGMGFHPEGEPVRFGRGGEFDGCGHSCRYGCHMTGPKA